MKFQAVVLSFLLAFAGANAIALQAQIENAVSWRESYTPVSGVAVGEELTLRFEASLEPGFHIYSVVNENNPGAITELGLDETSTDVALSGSLQDLEKPEVYKDEFFGDLNIFHGQATFIQKVKITGASPRIEGFIRYQVCDDSRCIPKTLDFSYAIATSEKKKTGEVKEDARTAPTPRENATSQRGLSEVPVLNVDPSGTLVPGRAAEEDTAGVASQKEDFSSQENEPPAPLVGRDEEIRPAPSRSLWSLILEGFLFGLASVLTPCIFPMIPLTVSYFTKRGSSQRKGIRDAAIYGLSIIGIYTGLALGLSAIFGPTVMQEVSINPWFNLGFFVLLLVFALSFMGMFEITLPSSWSTAVSKGSDKGGLGGIFLMALALAIVSFSCTGPIVATALGDAFYNGAFVAPSLTMLSFSTALALPFVVFAVFPNALNVLPRSGGWLNSVKVSLGLLELALALIYLSRADLTMHWELLSRNAFIGSWIVIFTILGFYLLGKIRLPHDSPLEKLSVPRLLLAMASFWFVLYLIPGLWGAPLKMLGGYLPSSTKDMGVLLQEGQFSQGPASAGPENEICNYPDKLHAHLSEGTPRGFCAFYDLEQGLAYAQEVNKPVFLDFTGHNCVNCRYLENNLWTDPQIRQYLTREYVLISLYVDDRAKLPEIEYTESGKKLRTVGDKWLHYEVNTYNSNAQPLYVLLDHDKHPLLSPIGYNPPLDVEEYRDFFARGLEVFRKRQAPAM